MPILTLRDRPIPVAISAVWCNHCCGFAAKYQKHHCHMKKMKDNMEKIHIGKIVNAVALKGEVKIYHYCDSNERFEELRRLIIRKNGRKPEETELEIENVRYRKNMVIVKLKGIDDRNKAESLKDSDVLITEEDLKELPSDTFYIRDLIGCDVFVKENPSAIGTISDVIQNSAQDIYQVDMKDGQQALIPAVGQFIMSVDIAGRAVIINPIPGLIPGM